MPDVGGRVRVPRHRSLPREQDVRRRRVLVQELDAGRETQLTAECEEPPAVRALEAGQEGHTVVETSVTR
ncbi:hypothetical protein ACWFRM_27945 [Streptomyces sp. NPDC055144]